MKIEDAKNVLRGMVPAFAERIAPAYLAMNWKWYGHGFEHPHIPSEEEIAQCLNRLIDNLSRPGCCSTGGLHVRYSEKDHEASITFADEKIYYFDKCDPYEKTAEEAAP